MMLKLKMAFAAGVVGLATLVGASTMAQAAPAAGAPLAAISKSTPGAIEKVHYRGARHACAHRFGWKTRGYYRCLDRRGHGHARPILHSCKANRHACADRWGWRTSRYYRCVRNRGC